MSKRSKTKVEPIPASEGEHDAYLSERANDAWQEFILNEQPAALAKYLQAGGVINDGVREILVEILKNDRGGKPGGSKPFRDLETYTSVNHILKIEEFARRLGGADNPNSKPLTKRQALLQYSEMTRQELRAVELQYDRGKKISNKYQ